MKLKTLLCTISVLLCLALLFSCEYIMPDNSDPDDGSILNPDDDSSTKDESNNDDNLPSAPTEPTDPEEQLPELGYRVGNLCYDYEVGLVDESGSIKISDLRGKIVIINFWGTWCTPCVAELPHFNEVANEYADEVVVVAIHSTEGLSDASGYIEQYYSDSKIIFAHDEVNPANPITDDYYVTLGGRGTYPMTLVLDEDGVITFKRMGSLTKAELDAAIAETKGTDDSGDDNQQGGNTPDNNDNNQQGGADNDQSDENVKIDLPDDYVITIADMERFLLTKDEQYPITNEYVELYQQASGGYIDNAIKAGLVVDKAQHLPSQKWHYFDSWLYATIEEGMSWDASASSRSYSNFACPELLLWIIEATGVDAAKVREAKDIAVTGKEAGDRVQTICASIRAAVPFNTYLRPLIIDFLENNPAGYDSHNVTVSTDSAYQVNSLKQSYIERETVTFTVLISDSTKEIDKVTVNGSVLAAASGTTYRFSMPDEDVSIVITLKDKAAGSLPVEPTKDYYYDVVYTLPGKTAVSFTDPADAYGVFQFNGKQENVISSVSNVTNVYGGGRGGSGDNIWYSGDMLKLGTTSVTGSITLELTKNVTGVIITGYVTNDNCIIRVGDSDSTVWSGGSDDGKTTEITANGDYAMNIAGKDTVAADATSTIQINFDSTDSLTISTVKNGSKYYVLYITAIEFIVDAD